jgi:hypothetical protein
MFVEKQPAKILSSDRSDMYNRLKVGKLKVKELEIYPLIPNF